MFQLFQKKQTPKPKADIDTQIKQVLAGIELYQSSFLNLVSDMNVSGDVLELFVRLPNDADKQQLQQAYETLQTQVYALGVHEVNLNVAMPAKTPSKQTPTSGVQTHRPKSDTAQPNDQKTAPNQSQIPAHPRIKHIIAIASGKGGVGKSTTTVNIALALQRMGHKVGVLDADIYGPSMPDMLGVAGVKPQVENDQFIPIDAGGIAMLSIGSLLDSDSTPVAWRGIKATGALMQLYGQTNWPNLDYLLIDMPPGTGDIQLTLAQRIPITGAIIVTTPQHIALLDAKKGVEMFTKTQIAVMGIVENMAIHICTNCGHQEAIFGSGGADEMMAQYGTPLLGRLPLDARIRTQMDLGQASVLDDAIKKLYDDIATQIQSQIGRYAKHRDDGRIF